MRVPRRDVPIQPLTYMWERHKEIARLVVSGLRPIDIAEKLGMGTCRLSLIMNSPVFKEYLSTLSAKRDEGALDIKGELLKGAEKGVQLLNNFLVDDEVPKSTKAKIALDFLDRTGFGRSTTVNTNSVVVHCTESRLERLKREQRELLGGMRTITLESNNE